MASVARQTVHKLPEPLKRVLRTALARMRSGHGDQRPERNQRRPSRAAYPRNLSHRRR